MPIPHNFEEGLVAYLYGGGSVSTASGPKVIRIIEPLGKPDYHV
jgi:hypothetical protein